jgi:predicted nucleic acid-binding protein
MKNFKKFRNSQGFKPIAQDIAAAIRHVLRHCERVESGFDMLNIEGLISEYEMGKSDFNDQVIAILCQRKGLKLLTDDGDFRGQGIPMVTANRRLLA